MMKTIFSDYLTIFYKKLLQKLFIFVQKNLLMLINIIFINYYWNW